MKTYKLHLIRHGMTEGNIKGQYIGRTELPVTPEGIAMLKNLKEQLDYPFVDRVYSSPMLRCRQTANMLYPEREITLVDNLIEYDFGDFEGKTANELEHTKEYIEWTSGKANGTPNGEDNTEFTKRICLGINEIVRDMMNNDYSDAAVIMHGGTIMTFLAACALPRHSLVEWATENGRGYTIMVTPTLYQRSGIVEVIDLI